MTKNLLDQCVKLNLNYASANEAISWCEENLGIRVVHPVLTTYVDTNKYIDRSWAVTANSGISFWFANEQDRMQFALIFG